MPLDSPLRMLIRPFSPLRTNDENYSANPVPSRSACRSIALVWRRKTPEASGGGHVLVKRHQFLSLTGLLA